MSNATGSGAPSYASREAQMKAYDSLPRVIREALANAAFDWAPYPIARRFNRATRHDMAKRLAADIARWDADQVAKDRVRVWGWPRERGAKRRGR